MESRNTPLVRGTDVRILAASVATGVIVALVVALFDAVAVEVVWHWLSEQDLAVRAAAPLVGTILAVLILRYLAYDSTASTSDEYVRAFHERHPSIPLREVPGKLLAGISTIGLGGAVVYPLLPAGSLVGPILWGLVGGSLVGSVFLLDATVADVVDWDEAVHGVPRERLYFGFYHGLTRSYTEAPSLLCFRALPCFYRGELHCEFRKSN